MITPRCLKTTRDRLRYRVKSFHLFSLYIDCLVRVREVEEWPVMTTLLIAVLRTLARDVDFVFCFKYP